MDASNIEDEIKVFELEALCFRLFLERKSDIDNPTKVTENESVDNQEVPKSLSLSMNKKLEIATSLLGDIQHETLERKRIHSERVDSINISLEAINLRLVDLEKDAFAFKRDVVVKVNDENLGRGNNARVIRYFQARILGLESILGRLKVQHSDYKRKLKKLLVQSKQRDMVGTSIHFLDFHQLQIDTKRQIQRLYERTNELGRVKVIVSKHHSRLITTRETVLATENDLLSVDKAVVLRDKHMANLDVTIEEIKNKIEKSTQPTTSNGYNKEETNIMDLIDRQHELYSLQKDLNLWKRKVDLSQKK